MPLLETLLPLAAFLIGALLGEAISYRAFGVPKNSFVLVLDIIFFVFLISFISTYLNFSSLDVPYYLINFFTGLLSIPLIRGVEDLLGLTKKSYLSNSVSIDIIKALSHAGLEKSEITQILQKIGYSPEDAEKYDSFISKTVPAYLPKFVRIEKTLESIDSRLNALFLDKYIQQKLSKKKSRRKKTR